MKAEILQILSKETLKKSQLRRRVCNAKDELEQFNSVISELKREGAIKKEFGGKYSLQESQLVTGTLSLSAGGYGFVNPEDKSTTIFIPPDKTGAAVNGEVVQVSITEQSKKGPVGKIVNILESKLDLLSGQLEIRKGQPWLIPLRVGIPAVELSIESVSPDIKEGDWIRAKLVSRDTQTGKITASLSQALGNANDLNAEIDAIIDEFDLKSEYSNEEEEAASRIRPRKIARRDLTKELITTIDPRDAKDFDDALSVHPAENEKHITIGIHIADVAAYIAPRSKLMTAIKKRAFTAYLPGRMLPMLPKVLVSTRCSLIENEVKPAHTVMITFDKTTGEVITTERFHSTIKVRKRLNYQEVQDYADTGFKGSPWGDDVCKDVKTLYDFSLLLRKRREKVEQFIPLDAPEVRVMCDPISMTINGLKTDSPSESKQMVEEYMLAANTAVAQELTTKIVPGLFRVHPEPDGEQAATFSVNAQIFYGIAPGDVTQRTNAIRFLNSIKGHPSAPAISMDFLRTMQRASYSSMKGLHFGLGKNLYSHFTSPIRRLADLLVHQQLWSLEDKGGPIYSKDRLDELADVINTREAITDEAYRTTINRFKLHYIEALEDGDEELQCPALITRIAAKKMRLYIPHYGMYANVNFRDLEMDFFDANVEKGTVTGRRTSTTWSCGDTIEVQILGADFKMREFIVQPITSSPSVKKHHPRTKKKEKEPVTEKFFEEILRQKKAKAKANKDGNTDDTPKKKKKSRRPKKKR
ncbi:ribonuclease R [Lentisphaera profundi]|uniref:Ribonuclease R n=1 Tax=Lentisphaera profundi TaxID=1658616 RepID=A0ABY7VP12_9BACT|nr:ribonuclease R family protein [Lentisphaera profundi]WDE95886.1 ribonuclease R [Lentisphaera profundi]